MDAKYMDYADNRKQTVPRINGIISELIMFGDKRYVLTYCPFAPSKMPSILI